MRDRSSSTSYAVADAGRRGWLRSLPAFILIFAVGFNALLAVINAHVMPVTAAVVVGCEVAIVAAAHVFALANYRRQMGIWYALTGILVLIALYRALATQQFEPKFLRDVLLIPTFVVLGMAFEARDLTRYVVILHAIVIGFLLLEAIDSSFYAKLFSIEDYYVNTRGLRLYDFWNQQSDLFVSATRPAARFFAFVDLHRLSSIFLEPVSLGNYCVTLTCFLCAAWTRLSSRQRWFLALGNVAAIIGCDGRLAALSSAAIVAVSVAAPLVPRFAWFLYLPGFVGAALVLTALNGLHSGTDDLSGRIALSAELLGRYDLADYMGTSSTYLLTAVDSGIAYLITTQSIIGVCIVWVFIAFAAQARTWEQVRYLHGLCLYISLSLMVSYAVFTIKTAALLWFVHGCLQAQCAPRDSRARRGPAYVTDRTFPVTV
jgi:putative polymerase